MWSETRRKLKQNSGHANASRPKRSEESVKRSGNIKQCIKVERGIECIKCCGQVKLMRTEN